MSGNNLNNSAMHVSGFTNTSSSTTNQTKQPHSRNTRSQQTHTHTINPSKPWLNDAFFSLLKERSRYFILKKKSPSNLYLAQKYSDICSQIKQMRFRLRSDYNARAINCCINNPKKLWSKLNEIIYNRSKAPNSMLPKQNTCCVNRVYLSISL